MPRTIRTGNPVSRRLHRGSKTWAGRTAATTRIEHRWSAGDAERTRKYAAELVALAPDVILAGNTSTVGPLQQATHTVPIVFAGVVDPVAAGFVDNLARPGCAITGFTQFEYGMSGKWLELLKEDCSARDASSGASWNPGGHN